MIAAARFALVAALAMGCGGGVDHEATDDRGTPVLPPADPPVDPPADPPQSVDRTPDPPSLATRWDNDWLVAEADRYLSDAEFRRATLLASLTNPANMYSAVRISSYGLQTRGWDALPEWIPATTTITDDTVAALRRGDRSALAVDPLPVWDGTRPTTMAQWVELGRRVFFAYPLRPEIFAEHALAHPAVADRVGLRAAPDGTWPGVVAFTDLDGEVKVGITCALCHVALDDDAMVIGRARRDLDYGQMRLAFFQDTGATLPDELAARMQTWGPGRADITQDDDEDPVAIPDLWQVRQQTHLTQAGTLAQVHPAALAIRQETQILYANLERTRPPRELAWALAMYVYSLTPPPRDVVVDADTERGATLFDAHCRSCHDEPNGSGTPVPAGRVGTEPALAFGHARGTGRYRPSPLVRVADAAPYLHHGEVASLEALLGPERLSEAYQGGARGPGPIAGHRWGTDLPPADRQALVAYLHTL